MALTFNEALGRYEVYAKARGFSSATIEHTRTCVALLDTFLGGGTAVVDITADHFRRFVADLRHRQRRHPGRGGVSRPLSGTSVNTYARAIRAFFNWLKREGLLEANPLATEAAPKKPKTLPKVYSEGDLKAVLEVVARDIRNKAIVFLFLDTGLRLAELSAMTLRSVDTKDGQALVMGKGQKQRTVPLHRWACEAVEDYIKNARPSTTETDRLFLKSDGQPLTASGVQSMLDRLGDAAGLTERLSPHKLRHTFATVSLKYEGNLEYIKQILGHSDIKTTSDSYLNADQTDIKAAHDKFSPLANVLEQRAQEDSDAEKEFEGRTETAPLEVAEQGKSQSIERTGGNGNEIRLIHGERYNLHLQRLSVLAGELASDIEAGNLEPRRLPLNPGAKSTFKNVDLAGVYRAQNSRLWPSLEQHLDNEFDNPRLTTQIVRAAVDQFLRRFRKQSVSARNNSDAVIAKLSLVSERGTFEGTCEICRGYFLTRQA